VSGSISISATGVYWVGGLVGAEDSSGGLITDSRATIKVITAAPVVAVGGIISRNFGTIQNSSVSANVVLEDRSELGGVAGENAGLISEVEFSGRLQADGDAIVGGIAAYNNQGMIEDSFSSGKIISAGGSSAVGGRPA
jgi:hypothetical protein